MTCFPCGVAKREVELRLADQGAHPAVIVAQVAATRCLMCATAEQQTPRSRPPEDPAQA
ncbi:MAG: hypothetical protein QOF77_682 [Solirubrobacteraceae bacterium]|nr:hypothetical protein [Solirubrobacteraceae bacterium]